MKSRSVARNVSGTMEQESGGFFLTDVKHPLREPSTTNKDESTAMRTIDASQEHYQTSPSQMVSFSFLTRVPLSDFLDVANKDAQQSIDRHTKRTHTKIISQLERDLQDKMMRWKLNKVLYEQKKMKKEQSTDENRQKHKERLETISKTRRKAQWEQLRRHKEITQQMAAEEQLRSEKIKRQVQLKLDSIAEFASSMRRKRNNVVKYH